MSDALKGPQFARQFALLPDSFAWFLGAGASAASGIPTGYAMISDFKKRLFCELSKLPQKSIDASDPLWAHRIDDLLSRRSTLPSAGDPTEYSKAFEAAYPTAESRRSYIENAVRIGTPSFAHRVLGSLLSIKQALCVFTTNFDAMVETAATLAVQLLPSSERTPLTTAAIDSAARAERCLQESAWPLLAKLHGDFQSVELKNTSEELRSQDQKMRDVLVTACRRFGLVVVGYSGRDESIMQTFYQVLQERNAFPGGLYWVAQPGRPILPAVSTFLADARQAGVKAFLVDAQNFDELAADIYDEMKFPEALTSHILQSRPAQVITDAPIPGKEKHKFPILQCSALRLLSLPKVARRIQLPSPITTANARELLKAAKVRATVAVNGDELAAFGADSDLISAFSGVGARLAGEVELRPDADSWAKGLLHDALARALCRRRPLSPRMRRRGHFIIVRQSHPDETSEISAIRERQLTGLKRAYSSPLVGTVKNFDCLYHEGVRIRLDHALESWWCVFEPSTYVDIPRKSEEAISRADQLKTPTVLEHTNALADWRRERWAQRYNPVWTRIIAAWAKLLSEDSSGSVFAHDLKGESGFNGEFLLSTQVAWSRPNHDHDYFRRASR